jgi:predicted  nucleic acid-binding Zn-ribbon protein
LLKAENAQLKDEISDLNTKISKLDEEQESINLYSRRDCLEFHGILQRSDENTDELIKRVADLVGVEIGPNDISTSHRLLSRSG